MCLYASMTRIIGILIGLMWLGCGSANTTTATTKAGPPRGSEARQETPVESDVSVPGVDMTGFSGDEAKRWQTLLQALQAPCRKEQSVAACIEEQERCADDCRHAARYASRLVVEGYSDSDIVELHRLRYDESAVAQLQIDASQAKGDAAAPITIVAFSDFECPYCAVAAALLEQLMQKYQGKLRVVMKHFPLPQHEFAFPAAKAAVAAGAQEKFWPMHDALFAKQSELSTKVIEQLAKELKLDLNRFRKDLRSEATEAKVKAEMDEATRLAVRGTPTLFINGRMYVEPLDSLGSYLNEEFAP